MTALTFASARKAAVPGNRKKMSAAGTAPKHEAKIQHKKENDRTDQRKRAGFTSRSGDGNHTGQRKNQGACPSEYPSAVVGFPGVAVFEVGTNLFQAMMPTLEDGSG
jgi:hypothetical protein